MMKKRNFNILAGFIAITIGAYFIYTSAVSKIPVYELKDISGDRKAMGDLVITNKVFVSSYRYIKSTIDKDNTKAEEGYFDTSRGMDYSDKEYKDFYLGNLILDGHKDESNEFLFFAQVDNNNEKMKNELEIRIMNKKNKELKEMKLPLEKNIDGFTQKVAISEEKGIVVIGLHDRINGKSSTRIYSFNLETGEKINEISIDKDLTGKNNIKEVNGGHITLLSGPQYDNSGDSEKSCELFIYDIKENKIKTIALKDMNIERLSVTGSYEDLYLIDDDLMKIYKVDIEKSSVEEKGTLPLDYSHGILSAVVSKDRLYIASSQKYDKKIIDVVDTENMKNLYEGEIQAKDGIDMSGILELNL